jgi:hypothetical protein
MNIEDLFNKIVADNTAEYIAGKVDEYIPEYIWDWEDEFEDIHEAYEEQGRGQAESQILGEVISRTKATLSIDDYCKLQDKLAAHWGITIC